MRSLPLHDAHFWCTKHQFAFVSCTHVKRKLFLLLAPVQCILWIRLGFFFGYFTRPHTPTAINFRFYAHNNIFVIFQRLRSDVNVLNFPIFTMCYSCYFVLTFTMYTCIEQWVLSLFCVFSLWFLFFARFRIFFGTS